MIYFNVPYLALIESKNNRLNDFWINIRKNIQNDDVNFVKINNFEQNYFFKLFDIQTKNTT